MRHLYSKNLKKTQPPKQQENCERENGERDCDTIFVLDTYEEEL